MILMDVRMPTLDGYETAKLIRQRARRALTPIIFITACQGMTRPTAAAYASGAVDFIFTPIIPEVLRAKVSTFVDLFVQSQQLQRSLESITALNAALRDSEARTQAVLQNVADGIVTADEGGLIESFNQSARRLFGYTEEEVVGLPLRVVIAPERHDEFSASHTGHREPAHRQGRSREADRDGRPPQGRLVLPHGDGNGQMQHRRADASRSPAFATSPSARPTPRPLSTRPSTTLSPGCRTAPCSVIACDQALASASGPTSRAVCC